MVAKIIPVIVSYNRKNLLVECVQALLEQILPIHKIVIIDNASIDGTVEYFKNNEDNRIIFYPLEKNIGSAAGFKFGMEKALKLEADWIWIMDDDAIAEPSALEILGKYFNEDCVALAPKVISTAGEIQIFHRGIINLKKVWPKTQSPLSLAKYLASDRIAISFASFVGLLVSCRAVSQIGFPDSKFFIHGEDVDYSIRLNKIGKILLIPASVIVHKDQNSATKRVISFLGKNFFRSPLKTFWIEYYCPRNLAYLGKHYGLNFASYISGLVISMLKALILIILFDDRKILRLKTIILAYYDGFKGNFSRKITSLEDLEKI